MITCYLRLPNNTKYFCTCKYQALLKLKGRVWKRPIWFYFSLLKAKKKKISILNEKNNSPVDYFQNQIFHKSFNATVKKITTVYNNVKDHIKQSMQHILRNSQILKWTCILTHTVMYEITNNITNEINFVIYWNYNIIHNNVIYIFMLVCHCI